MYCSHGVIASTPISSHSVGTEYVYTFTAQGNPYYGPGTDGDTGFGSGFHYAYGAQGGTGFSIFAGNTINESAPYLSGGYPRLIFGITKYDSYGDYGDPGVFFFVHLTSSDGSEIFTVEHPGLPGGSLNSADAEYVLYPGPGVYFFIWQLAGTDYPAGWPTSGSDSITFIEP